MPRAKTRVASRQRRKKIIKSCKGYYGRRKSNLKLAKEAMDRAGMYSYAHRKDRKSAFRSLWIMRIGAAAKEAGTSYSKLIAGLSKAGIALNRKVLAELATSDAAAFQKVVAMSQAS